MKRLLFSARVFLSRSLPSPLTLLFLSALMPPYISLSSPHWRREEFKGEQPEGFRCGSNWWGLERHKCFSWFHKEISSLQFYHISWRIKLRGSNQNMKKLAKPASPPHNPHLTSAGFERLWVEIFITPEVGV